MISDTLQTVNSFTSSDNVVVINGKPMLGYFSYFSTKTYGVGTQKNRLNETVLLSTQNMCLYCWVRKKNAILRSKILFN